MGPLSGLAYNRGLASESGRGYQANPPAFAAARLDSALAQAGHLRARRARGRARPPRRRGCWPRVQSPTMARLAALTNKPSDNFFAEMLVKALADQTGTGTTRRGARLAAAFARRIGGRPAGLADGSGLSRGNRASPYRVAKLLLAMRTRDEFDPFFASLSIAGRDGTLRPRMRGGAGARPLPRARPARCRTSPPCRATAAPARARPTSFSILMNSVNPFGARAVQDRMLHAIAAVR